MLNYIKNMQRDPRSPLNKPRYAVCQIHWKAKDSYDFKQHYKALEAFNLEYVNNQEYTIGLSQKYRPFEGKIHNTCEVNLQIERPYEEDELESDLEMFIGMIKAILANTTFQVK